MAEHTQNAPQSDHDTLPISKESTTPSHSRARFKRPTRINRKIVESVFPKAYIKNGLNAGKALQSIKPHIKYITAQKEGHIIANRPEVRKGIEEELSRSGLDIALVSDIHKRNLSQSKNLAVSQHAVDTFYKITGKMTPDTQAQQTNIALIIER